MRVGGMLSAVLGFQAYPTTLLAVLIYASIFAAVYVTDDVPRLPRTDPILDQAFVDLHHIAARPHPYNSHANDRVREYLLTRLYNISSAYPHVQIDISSDLTSAPSFLSGINPKTHRGSATYFEGTNILVKIHPDVHSANHSASKFADAVEPTGILFSAHYDSVSTAPGATDNGMGVATVLYLIRHFAEMKPGERKRTAVFLLNNGEEDGLHGAHAYYGHPWANLTSTFLNLEGAGSGGRPLLFRSTSILPLLPLTSSSMFPFKSARRRNYPHPHANALSADAFRQGLIRSATDYSVFERGVAGTGATHIPGMQGLDLAFYRHRSKYHTRFDGVGSLSQIPPNNKALQLSNTVPCAIATQAGRRQPYAHARPLPLPLPLPPQHVTGASARSSPHIQATRASQSGKRALWAMVESARGVASAWVVADVREGEGKREAEGAVYFDVLGRFLIILPQHTLLITNIILLTVGPFTLLALALLRAFCVRRRSHSAENQPEGAHSKDAGVTHGIKRRVSSARWWWGHVRFWFALVVGVAVQVGWVVLWVWGNRWIVYSHPFLVFVSTLTLAYLTFVIPLTLFSPHPPLAPNQEEKYAHTRAAHEKHTLLHHTYALTWVLVLLGTIALAKDGLVALFWASVWNVGLGAACVVEGVGAFLAAFGGNSSGNSQDLTEEPDETGHGEHHPPSREVVRPDTGDASTARIRVRGVMFDAEAYEAERVAEENTENGDGEGVGVGVETDPTEITPLLAQPEDVRGGPGKGKRKEKKDKAKPKRGEDVYEDEEGTPDMIWWAVQMLLSVPLTVLLVAQIGVLLLESMPGTLVDGSPPVTVYAATSFISILLILPLLPFAPKMHRLLTWAALVTCVVCTLYAWGVGVGSGPVSGVGAGNAFSQAEPLKVFFQQTVEVGSQKETVRQPGSTWNPGVSGHGSEVVFGTGPLVSQDTTTTNMRQTRNTDAEDSAFIRVETSLTGVPGYLPNRVLPHLPSTWGKEVRCVRNAVRDGLETCTWDSAELTPEPGVGVSRGKQGKDLKNGTGNGWIDVRTERLGNDSARIWVKGVNTRSCRLYFDNKPVREYSVKSGNATGGIGGMGGRVDENRMQGGYEVPETGLGEVRLWSRTWDREFVVDVTWDSSADKRSFDGSGAGVGTWNAEENDGLLRGRASCNWAEYESASAGAGAWDVEGELTDAEAEAGGCTGGKIPAYEEALAFLPLWAVPTKNADGLVEVWQSFAV